MSTRTVLLPIVTSIEQVPVAAEITIALLSAPVAAGGGLLIALTEAGEVTGGEHTITTALDAVTPVDLTPNTEIAPSTLYRFTLRLPPDGIQRAWEVQIPPGETPIPWPELITMGDPLDPADLAALTLHLADDARHVPLAGASPNGSLLGLVAGLPVWVAAPAGAGDMQSAVYDPQAIAADAFDRANHTGTQTLATIEDAGSAAAEDVGTGPGNVVQLDVSARLPAVDGSQLTGLPSGVSDHGALSGLADDDHPQYLTEARGDLRYSPLDHDHDGDYDPAGSAAAAVAAHEGSFDHSAIATALQPGDALPTDLAAGLVWLGNAGGAAAAVPISGDATLAADGTLTVDKQVAAPATKTSPGTPGQWAASSPYLYFCVAPNTWWRWTPARDWT